MTGDSMDVRDKRATIGLQSWQRDNDWAPRKSIMRLHGFAASSCFELRRRLDGLNKCRAVGPASSGEARMFEQASYRLADPYPNAWPFE